MFCCWRFLLLLWCIISKVRRLTATKFCIVLQSKCNLKHLARNLGNFIS